MQNMQYQQDSQNGQNTQSTGAAGQQAIHPDETSYSAPQETGGSWVYGNPNLNYSGQAPSGGVPVYTMTGDAPPSNPDNAQMPIPGMNGDLQPGGITSAGAQSQRMKNPVDMKATHLPANSTEAYQASLRSLLDRNIGFFVVATFLVGTQQSVTWQGILHTVGSDYIVLYQPDYERYISCDFYSIKFVQFHNVKGVPYCAAAQSWQGQAGF